MITPSSKFSKKPCNEQHNEELVCLHHKFSCRLP